MEIVRERKRFYFWIVATLIALAALAAMVIWPHRVTAPRRAAFLMGDPQEGAKLFYQTKYCSTCHAVHGSGGTLAPDLAGTRPTAPAMGWLTAVLWNHAPGMWRQMRIRNTPYPQLDPQELADTLAFLYQSAGEDQPGDAQAGKLVFEEKGCAHCHSVRSEGGKSAPELAIPPGEEGTTSWLRAMWNHTAAMIDPVTKTLGEWPALSGKQMNDLLAFVSAGAPPSPANARGNPERGWAAFQEKCMRCHSVNGRGGNSGPELGPSHDLPLRTAEFAAVLWNHAPAMAQHVKDQGIPLPKLDRGEFTDMRAFLASLRYYEPSGSPTVGEKVFRERGCAGCHGTAAEGTKSAPKLRNRPEAFSATSFAAALWKHGPKMVDHSEELGMKWPVLEATDVGNLVSFLDTPLPERGK